MLISCSTFKTYENEIKLKYQILDGIDELELYIEEQIEKYDLGRVSISILCENDIIYNSEFGTEKDEMYQAASISKAVSAYATLYLVQEGLLDLDIPLENYIDIPYISNDPRAGLITAEMVLSHSSGLPNDISGKNRRIYFEPGTEFSYSGGGFTYLQTVIESITGKPFNEFMEETILPQINMKNSSFSYEHEGKLKVYAGCSLFTNSYDIAVFFSELFDPVFVNEDLVNLMLEPYIKVNANTYWSLGLGIQISKSGDAVWHWGNNYGYNYSLAVMYKDSRTGAVLMVEGEKGIHVLKQIIHKAIGGPHYLYWAGL
jgi:CubicO group peptidase (beta-lactamase class C family)